MDLVQEEKKAMAFAGICQAAVMANDFAFGKTVQEDALRCSISSLFSFEPDSVEDVYGNPAQLYLGYQLIEAVFTNQVQQYDPNAVRIILSLIQVENLLRKNQNMLETIRAGLENIRPTRAQNINEETLAGIADLYQNTISKLSVRIEVKGKSEILKITENANTIRAILMTGIRSAVLWRQLGGRRWQLLFSRRSLLRALAKLKQKQP